MLLYFLVFNKTALIFTSSSTDNQITKKQCIKKNDFM